MTFPNMVLAHRAQYAGVKTTRHSGECQDGQESPLEDQSLNKTVELKTTRSMRSTDMFLSVSEIITRQ